MTCGGSRKSNYAPSKTLSYVRYWSDSPLHCHSSTDKSLFSYMAPLLEVLLNDLNRLESQQNENSNKSPE